MKINAKGVLHWHKYEWQEAPDFQLCSSNMESCGPEYVAIQDIELEVEIPDDFDPRPKQVAALREKKQEILSEATLKANNIDEQIQRLLSIENKTEEA